MEEFMNFHLYILMELCCTFCHERYALMMVLTENCASASKRDAMHHVNDAPMIRNNVMFIQCLCQH